MTDKSVFWLAAVPLALVYGCGGGSDPSPSGAGGSVGGSGTGGQSQTTGHGGTSAVSNVTPGTGGATATGGDQATGGARATGGAPAAGGTTGGAPAAGGTTASGGSLVATGGSKTSASTSTKATGGGNATGGTRSPGGTSSTGGVKASGGGTSSPGGASTGGANAGGAASNSTSPGCGNGSPLKTGTFTETINGTSRKWMLDVPNGYDATKPYRLIFVWHPLGGSGSQVVSGGFNGLKSQANSTTIFATADGLDGKSSGGSSGTGWWNEDGGDIKLVQIMLDKISSSLCIDQKRIFSTGFSFGGMMSYTLPFEFNVFRAVAPCSGKTGVIPYDEKFDGPVPIMAFHGDKDTFVATALGKEFLDKYRTRNHCGSDSKPVDPSPCVQYQGCDVPTIWCVFPGAHEIWGQEAQAIWKFFSQF